MGKIIAMGGGEAEPIFRYMVSLVTAARKKKHFLFVATASGDDEHTFHRMSDMMARLGCESKPLYLLRERNTEASIQEKLDWADLLYVCGGNTYTMMQVWRKNGFDRMLAKEAEKGRLILSGSSAGGICWFSSGYSDSAPAEERGNNPYGWIEGIGLFPERFCPHYNSRGEEFAKELASLPQDGIALNDYTAVVMEDGTPTFLYCYEESPTVLMFRHEGDRLVKVIPERIVKLPS